MKLVKTKILGCVLRGVGGGGGGWGLRIPLRKRRAKYES